MKPEIDRRTFLRFAGSAIGTSVLYQFLPVGSGRAAANPITDFYRRANGEAPGAFSFAQFSDTHVGFEGPPDPLGARAFESAVELMNQAPQPPDFVLFTGDLTHDVDDRDQHAARMRRFRAIAGRLKAKNIHAVPGENDAALDHGVLYREQFGETHYSFDHKGVHFIGLDNVSRGRPEVGAEQIAWLKADLARFPTTAPLVVFTHRPLFDLKPEWEWFTRDGPAVMEALAPYENVTILYGHIHRHHIQKSGNAAHYAARSLIFAFNDPARDAEKKPLPFDQKDPFKELGLRLVRAGRSAADRPAIDDIVLSRREFAGLSGVQQIIKPNREIEGSSPNEND